MSEEAIILERVRVALGQMPILSAASDLEPWFKARLCDFTAIQRIADGEDPAAWKREPCDRTFGHSPHHWTDYEDGREPLRISHYCPGEGGGDGS